MSERASLSGDAILCGDRENAYLLPLLGSPAYLVHIKADGRQAKTDRRRAARAAAWPRTVASLQSPLAGLGSRTGSLAHRSPRKRSVMSSVAVQRGSLRSAPSQKLTRRRSSAHCCWAAPAPTLACTWTWAATWATLQPRPPHSAPPSTASSPRPFLSRRRGRLGREMGSRARLTSREPRSSHHQHFSRPGGRPSAPLRSLQSISVARTFRAVWANATRRRWNEPGVGTRRRGTGLGCAARGDTVDSEREEHNNAQSGH